MMSGACLVVGRSFFKRHDLTWGTPLGGLFPRQNGRRFFFELRSKPAFVFFLLLPPEWKHEDEFVELVFVPVNAKPLIEKASKLVSVLVLDGMLPSRAEILEFFEDLIVEVFPAHWGSFLEGALLGACVALVMADAISEVG